jgi:hypothetical protein
MCVCGMKSERTSKTVGVLKRTKLGDVIERGSVA